MSDLVSVLIPTWNRQKDVIECVDSVLKSDYKNIEVIVVDNASSDNTLNELKKKFGKKIKLIVSKTNLGAGGGRNLGAKQAKGKYLLFVDSDNIIHKSMISNLVHFLKKQKNCVMAGPLMLYKQDPSIIWLYFADINFFTSQAIYKGTRQKDEKQYPQIIEVGHIPNCFMVKKNDFLKVGGFDDKYIIMYEEADFAEKIKKQLKKKIFIFTKAITYHNIPLTSLRGVNAKSKKILYLTSRNRIYFMKKNSNLFQFFLFLIIINPIITLYYLFNLIKKKSFSKALSYLKGVFDGLFLF